MYKIAEFEISNKHIQSLLQQKLFWKNDAYETKFIVAHNIIKQ